MSAYLYDGAPFSWQQQQQQQGGSSEAGSRAGAAEWDLFSVLKGREASGVQLVPLLERFHVDVALQVQCDQ